MFRNRKGSGVLGTVMLGLVIGLTACSPAATPATVLPTTVPSTVVNTVPAPSTENAAVTEVSTSSAATSSATSASTVSTQAATGNASANAAACTLLNLNDVTGDQLLKTIPSFSSRMVREFQEYRPYVSILQFRKEIGKYVDANQVAQYEKYVFVPVDANKADADTLKQLPGVTDATATALVNARPYASKQAFLDTLGKYVSADQVAAAGCYLAATA